MVLPPDEDATLPLYPGEEVRPVIRGGVGISPRGVKGSTVNLAHTLPRDPDFSVSAADTFTSVHRFKGSIPQ